MTQSEQSKLVDPFERQSILSLHPRTFRDSPKSNDLEAIHQYMTSLALQNSGKVFEEAQSIIDGSSKIVNTTENYEPIMKENEAPRKNRPALPRKRAKFSMKPAISQPYTVTEPTLERDKLPRDPKKYFEAVKEHENAVKELKRQRGEDTNEPKKPTTARQRRPEIAWRKATYQHHVYSSQPESDTVFSQEPVQDTVRSQPIHNSQHESVIPNDQSKEKEGAETVTRAEDGVKKLFDELLSSNIADLDENEALSYLKDRLNIKPVSIPDDIPRVDFLSSFDSIEGLDMLPATRAFSDNLERNTLGKPKKLPDKLVNSPSSPTPPRNPFLAISKLSKLLSRSTESDDPFSARGVDLFPGTTCEIISGPSAGASKDKEFVESAGRGKEFVESASKGNLSEVLIGKEHREEMHNMEEMDVDIEGNGEDMVDKAASPTPTRLYLDVDENINGSLHRENEIGDNIEDTTEKVVPSSPQENVEITMEDLESNPLSAQKDDSSNNDPAATPDPNPDMVSEQQNEESPKTINKRVKSRARKVDPKKKRHSLAAQKDDSSNNVPAATSDPNPDMVSEQQNEESPKTINKRVKSRARKINPQKKRHSLAGGGSSWAGGVRKSNRIKTKPLEYWKGERPLYARIHDSLPTVVGVKYLSPSTAGFKVKSYVADKYKDLVDLSSLH